MSDVHGGWSRNESGRQVQETLQAAGSDQMNHLLSLNKAEPSGPAAERPSETGLCRHPLSLISRPSMISCSGFRIVSNKECAHVYVGGLDGWSPKCITRDSGCQHQFACQFTGTQCFQPRASSRNDRLYLLLVSAALHSNTPSHDTGTGCYQETILWLLSSGFGQKVTGGYPVCQTDLQNQFHQRYRPLLSKADLV